MSDPWFYFNCPMCRSRLRIKSEYTHMRGRCPACGFRIEPPDPKPLTVRPALHEPNGLILDDEEWPEPATVMGEQPAGTESTYAVDEKGSIVPKTSQIEEIDTGGIYNLVFDPDAPKTPGVTRTAEWDQPGAQPTPSNTPTSALQPLAVKNEPPPPATPKTQAALSSETEVDPLFGDVVKILGPAADANATVPPSMPNASAAQKTPPPSPPVARLATSEEVQTKRAISPAPISRIETTSSPNTKKSSTSGPSRKPVAEDTSSLVTIAKDKPAEETHVYELSGAELKPRQAGPPPKKLFFDGVFDFAWRQGNWKPWLWLSVGFTLIFAVLYLIFFLAGKGPAGVVGGGAFGMAGLLVAVWTLSYASVCMQAAVSETATGNDRIEWPQEGWRETFFPSFRIYYYYLVAALVTYPLTFVGSGTIGWQIATLFIFPAFFFSGLASANTWTLLHADVVRTIVSKIRLYLVMYVLSLLVLGIGGTLFVFSIDYASLVPVAGIIFPACWLIYARLLGRMAYVLNEEAPEKAMKKRKKKKKKAPAESEDSEAERESNDAHHSESASTNGPAFAVSPKPIPTASAQPPADVYAVQEPGK